MSTQSPRVIEDFPLATLDEAALIEQLSRNIGAPSGDRIKATQDKKFILPDGTKVDTLEAVVVSFGTHNTFYAGPYNRNKPEAPACFAVGLDPRNMIPSDNAPDRQADTCGSCPNNQWGSGAGGKGKACKNARVIALMPVNATQDSPIWLLHTSPTAIKHFDEYVRNLMQRKIPPLRVVTQVYFDPASTFASVRFRALEPVEPDLVGLYASRIEAAQERLLTEPDVTAFAG